LVIDSLSAGGRDDSPVWHRSFWAITEGVVASTLLLAGGLKALQTMAVATALPFAVIMLIAAMGMWRALVIEGHTEVSLQSHMRRAKQNADARGGWKNRLARMVHFPGRAEVINFITGEVMNSMTHVEKELKAKGWAATVTHDETNARVYLQVVRNDQVDFLYDIRLCEYLIPEFAYPELPPDDSRLRHYYRAEVFLRRGGQSYDIYGYDGSQVIDDILNQFEKYLHFLHVSPGVLPWNMDEHDDMLQTDGESAA
jgi:choline/glycine/proline betaine transport protein